MHHQTLYSLIVAAVAASVLWHYLPVDRPVVRNTSLLFLFGLFGQFAIASLPPLGSTEVVATIHEVFVIASGMALIRLNAMLLFRVLLPRLNLYPTGILQDIMVIIAYVVWGMVRLRHAGLDLSGIVTTSAVITGIVAFSMQDTLGNLLGGLALELDSSLEIGDWVKVDDIVGKIGEIRWRCTTIETRNGETVVIPNAQLMKNKISVLGRRQNQPLQWRRWVWFNVDYSVTPALVIATIESALQGTLIERVARAPLPNCVLMDLAPQGYGRYAVRYWLTELLHDDATDSQVRSHVFAALQRAGIRLAVPEHNIHVTEEDEKHHLDVRSREIGKRLAVLGKTSLLADLNEAELHTIAERLVFSPFAQGDIITRQGAIAHWLYIISAGEAEVVLEVDGQSPRILSTVGAGNFVGEMGLMTGAPRRATIIAKTDVECYRLDKASFESVLKSRPSLASAMSDILAARQFQNDNARKDADQTLPRAQQQGEILAKIKQFFGMV